MVASLTGCAKSGRGAWLLLLCAIPVFSAAQELADPTRPPEEITGRPKAGGELNELQSVIISPTRRAAIIHGQTVELGGKVGDSRLIEVNESGVVLQGVKGLEVLTLFPNVKLNRKAAMLPLREDSVRKGGAVAKPAGKAGAEEGK